MVVQEVSLDFLKTSYDLVTGRNHSPLISIKPLVKNLRFSLVFDRFCVRWSYIERLMIIDAHVNITYNGRWFDTEYDASLERLFDEMDVSGIDQCLLISMPFATNNEYIAEVIEKFPEKFRGLGHLDFATGNLLGQVGEILSMGLSGVKIHPRMQGIDCNDPRLMKLFNYLDDQQAVVMIDGYYQSNSEKVSLLNLLPFKYDLLAKNYPNVRFIISHMGGHRAFDLFFVAKSNKNVFIDNSHALKYFYGTSLIQDMSWIMDNLDEKIVFGSDFPEYGLSEYLEHFEDITKNAVSLRKELIYTNVKKIIEFA